MTSGSVSEVITILEVAWVPLGYVKINHPPAPATGKQVPEKTRKRPGKKGWEAGVTDREPPAMLALKLSLSDVYTLY